MEGGRGLRCPGQGRNKTLGGVCRRPPCQVRDRSDGLKAEGKERLSEERRGGGLSLFEGQGRRTVVPWRNREAEVERGWKWEAGAQEP